MRIVNAGFQRICEPTKMKQIERIARICYKSEDKICEGSDLKMVRNLISRRHLAMLEHANAIFEINGSLYGELDELISCWEGRQATGTGRHQRCYLRMTQTKARGHKDRYLVSGNLRAWYECAEYAHTDYLSIWDVSPELTGLFAFVNGRIGNILDTFLDYVDKEETMQAPIREIMDPSELTDAERMVHERFTVLFTTDRGGSHELVRMREASFAQESTRYVNYSKEKFGREITVLSPIFFTQDDQPGSPYSRWKDACEAAEKQYLELTDMGIPAQQARTVLPHSTKVDIAVTANLEEWRHILELRACDKTGPAHPQMKEIMVPLLKDLAPDYPFAFKDLVPAPIQ